MLVGVGIKRRKEYSESVQLHNEGCLCFAVYHAPYISLASGQDRLPNLNYDRRGEAFEALVDST